MNYPIDLSQNQMYVCDSVTNAIASHYLESAVLGEAGTGKTTCAPHNINLLHQKDPTSPQFVVSPTNKAAKVLRDKLGGHPVTTVHRLIGAKPFDITSKERDEIADEISSLTSQPLYDNKKASQLVRKHERLRKEGLLTDDESIRNGIEEFAKSHPGAIIHIDECSMIEKSWRQAFRDFGIRVIYYGDPHQLPPIDGDEWLHEAEHAYYLTDNFRQAAGSQIIDAALMVRNSQDGDIISIVNNIISGRYTGVGSDLQIKPYSDTEGFYKDIAFNSDQVIAYRSAPAINDRGEHSTKIQLHYLNQRIREALGITNPLPIEGEPLVLTEAFKPRDTVEWYVGDTFITKSSAKGLGINDIPITWNPKELVARIPSEHATYWKDSCAVVRESGAFILDLAHEGGEVYRNVAINPIIQQTPPLRMQNALSEKRGDGDPAKRCMRVDFGYSINGHQAQGSEYNRVTVFIEPGFLSWVDKKAKQKGGSPVARRWIYTALTRAKESLSIVIPPNYS